MRSTSALLYLLLIAVLTPPVLAQEAKTGYLKVDHTVFTSPNGQAIKKLPRGTLVKAVPVEASSHWFLIYTRDETGEQRAGYTMDPWLMDTLPPGMARETAETPPVQAQVQAPPPASVRAPEIGQTRYVHTFTNVRSSPSISSDVVAQLPPGSHVEIADIEGKWALVFRPHAHDETADEALVPLGYIALSLLKTVPPSPEETTLVYVTRSGKKYHLKDCRYVRKSRLTLTLKEAKEKGYEPCKVCHPPQN
jgi:hypothetical protein